MLATTIISRKRDCAELSDDEIRFMVQGMIDGSIADYQMSAWAMAVLCRGMTPRETATLTDCMLHSGTRLQRTSQRPRVDKHSTGGLGDKVSLVLAPLLACFDVEVPMLSGRGLGITGGTLDKLEAYPGFRSDLSQQEIAIQLERLGCVVTGTTPDIAPADSKLYRLRDVTGTVPSIALITASILSKKLSETLDALVLDVKFGSGAFMKTVQDARSLATSLQSTSQHMGLAASAILSDMNQPLGRMVGNACEANEAVDVLSGTGPNDVLQLTLRLATEVLVRTRPGLDRAAAELELGRAIADGRALARYIAMIEAQGGKYQSHLALASCHLVLAQKSGWVAAMDGEQIGQAVIEMGGGRRALSDCVNPSVGLEMRCRIGDRVEAAQPLANIFTTSADARQTATQLLTSALTISPEPVLPPPLLPDDTLET